MLSRRLLSSAAAGGVTEWTYVSGSSLSGSSFYLSGLQENDYIVVFAGADSTSLTSTTISGHSNYNRGNIASINYYASDYYQPAGSSTASFSFSGNQPDYGVAVAFRSPNPSTSYTRTSLYDAVSISNSTPTHDNVSRTFSSGDLAILVMWLDDDNAVPVTAPTDSTFAAHDGTNNRGTIGVAIKNITTGGSYSWGSWGIGSNSDTWITVMYSLT